MKSTVLFLLAFLVLLTGIPVAFTFGGVSLAYAALTDNIDLFVHMPRRIYALMQSTTLMAVPLFIFMGVVLEKSGMAERLLESMGQLFGRVRGGLAVSTVLVGAVLAASTGVVGASVVAMAVIALPVMVRHGYSKELSSGTICASGTLGQIIPPSIVLIILGEVLQKPVGELFKAAVWPGVALVGAFVVYILVRSFLNKNIAPAMKSHEGEPVSSVLKTVLFSAIPPLLLIVLVLGSIFNGFATPTESAAVGAAGALFLTVLYRKFSMSMLQAAASETTRVTAMIFAILVGATAFSLVFSYTGGEEEVASMLASLPGGELGFLVLSMLTIFVLGFFIDFVEISYIVVPLLIPAAEALGIDLVWFGILIALNLQTSFLTPPFGFSLFYLRGASKDLVSTTQIYRGVMPFIAIQVCVLIGYAVWG